MRSMWSMATTSEQWSNASLSRAHAQNAWRAGLRGFIAFTDLTLPFHSASMRLASAAQAGSGGSVETGMGGAPAGNMGAAIGFPSLASRPAFATGELLRAGLARELLPDASPEEVGALHQNLLLEFDEPEEHGLG